MVIKLLPQKLRLVEDFWAHVALRSDSGVVGDVHLSSRLGVSDGQTEIRNDAHTVRPHEDVLALDVAMSNGRFPLLKTNVFREASKGESKCKLVNVPESRRSQCEGEGSR